MLKIYSNLFEGGARGAVTMSFDDSCIEDVRLIGIFDRYGIKGTFNINAGRIHPRAIAVSSAREVYRSHEIACHGYYHLDPSAVTKAQFASDVFSDRQAIERATGRVIEGFAYPFGAYDTSSEDILSSVGIKYARTVENTGRFDYIPDNFLKWHPTCHQRVSQDYVDDFIKRISVNSRQLSLFYIWGHGFEFKSEEDWVRIEEVCSRISQIEGIWLATNMQIYDYIQALRGVRYNVDNTLAYNPSSIDVWVSVLNPDVDNDCVRPIKVKIPAGKTINLLEAYNEGAHN